MSYWGAEVRMKHLCATALIWRKRLGPAVLKHHYRQLRHHLSRLMIRSKNTESLTMNFFEAGFPRDWSSRVFMQLSPVTAELELFVNVDRLIPENFATVSDDLVPIIVGKLLTDNAAFSNE